MVLSDTDKNRTLLGIDFLEQAGIIISAIQRGWWFINTPTSFFSYDNAKNYNSNENIDPINTTTGGISKSKKRRMRQLFKIKNMEKSIDIEDEVQPIISNQNQQTEFEFKKPEMLPQINWCKPKIIEFSSDEERTKECESILELIHSKFITTIMPVSPIKTPPKKIQKPSKISKKLQGLFGSDSDSFPERPRTPGADIKILDINIIEFQYEHSMLMNQFRNGLPSVLILIYLDDIIIISKTFEEHLDDLENVFKRLQEFQLRANHDEPTAGHYGINRTINRIMLLLVKNA